MQLTTSASSCTAHWPQHLHCRFAPPSASRQAHRIARRHKHLASHASTETRRLRTHHTYTLPDYNKLHEHLNYVQNSILNMKIQNIKISAKRPEMQVKHSEHADPISLRTHARDAGLIATGACRVWVFYFS
jgi:hypothetical protein